MASSETVRVGFLPCGDIMDDLVREMLDHQGVIYEVLKSGSSRQTNCPVVVTPRRSRDAIGEAAGVTGNEKSVVVAESEIDLNRVLAFLSGKVSSTEDVLSPFVNLAEERLVETIGSRLGDLGLTFERKVFWPGDAKACCVLTHDVDWLTYTPFHKAVLKSNRGLRSLLGKLAGGLRRKDYGWNFDTMAEMEGRYGFRSSYYFMTGYPQGFGRLSPEIIRLSELGHEIGLHGAKKSQRLRSALNSEWRTLEEKTGRRPAGVRHHILKLEIPNTWEIEATEGLEYDATLAYNRLFGFRGGICFPYRPFSSAGRLSITELPTAFMDFTALNRGLRGNEAKKILTKLAEEVERHHGVFVVNFHNTYLNRDTFPDVVELYEDLLKLVKERNYWVATAQECVEWWNGRAASSEHLTQYTSSVPVPTGQAGNRLHNGQQSR